jgi:hypothetical protein
MNPTYYHRWDSFDGVQTVTVTAGSQLTAKGGLGKGDAKAASGNGGDGKIFITAPVATPGITSPECSGAAMSTLCVVKARLANPLVSLP